MAEIFVFSQKALLLTYRYRISKKPKMKNFLFVLTILILLAIIWVLNQENKSLKSTNILITNPEKAPVAFSKNIDADELEFDGEFWKTTNKN